MALDSMALDPLLSTLFPFNSPCMQNPVVLLVFIKPLSFPFIHHIMLHHMHMSAHMFYSDNCQKLEDGALSFMFLASSAHHTMNS